MMKKPVLLSLFVDICIITGSGCGPAMTPTPTTLPILPPIQAPSPADDMAMVYVTGGEFEMGSG